jgi:putative alpha-1,2-mannosidase
MNSWLVWQMLGLYPVVTQPIFLIGSPWFDEINITVHSNYTLRVTASGLDSEGGRYYVHSVRINGKQWDKNWVEHEEIMVTGGKVEFELGKEMTMWETGPPPPSPGRLMQ